MKYLKKMTILLLCCLIAGCGKQSDVDENIENRSEQVLDVQNDEGKNENIQQPVDYDLTQMSSDMVYALVYQMMVAPEEFVGKKIRMKGNFYASYYQPTETYYYYCVIQDATACCSQGLEFIWEDNSHIYPDEYPAEGQEIIVEGVFETYKEEGDDYLYKHIVDASLELVSG